MDSLSFSQSKEPEIDWPKDMDVPPAVPSPAVDRPTIIEHKKVKSEKLLEEEGVWNFVEQTSSYDPAQAHLEARKKVDIKRRKNMSELSAHFEPDAKSGEDSKIRVLRVEAKGKGEKYDDVEVAESTFVKPSNTVAGQDMLTKIVSLFGDDGQPEEMIVIPPRKPALAAKIDVAIASEEPALDGFGEDLSGKSNIVVPPTKPAVRYVLAQPNKNVYEKGFVGGGVAKIHGIRNGIHEGRERLVIDVSDVTKYKVAVDHLRSVLRIKLENSDWGINPQGSLAKGSKLFGTYIAREQTDGSVMFEIRLKNKAQISDTMILRPNTSPHHRVVIDMRT